MINEVMREIAWKTFKIVMILAVIAIAIGVLIGYFIF